MRGILLLSFTPAWFPLFVIVFVLGHIIVGLDDCITLDFANAWFDDRARVPAISITRIATMTTLLSLVFFI